MFTKHITTYSQHIQQQKVQLWMFSIAYFACFITCISIAFSILMYITHHYLPYIATLLGGLCSNSFILCSSINDCVSIYLLINLSIYLSMNSPLICTFMYLFIYSIQSHSSIHGHFIFILMLIVTPTSICCCLLIN